MSKTCLKNEEKIVENMLKRSKNVPDDPRVSKN